MYLSFVSAPVPAITDRCSLALSLSEPRRYSDLRNIPRRLQYELEKAAQGVAQCEVSATRVVVDAALLRGGKSRRGGHRIVNISRNCGRI